MLFVEPILVLVTVYLSVVYGVLYARELFGVILPSLTHSNSLRGFPIHIQHSRIHNITKRSHFHRSWYRYQHRSINQLPSFASLSCSDQRMAWLPTTRKAVIWRYDRRALSCCGYLLVRMDRTVSKYTLVRSCHQYDLYRNQHQPYFHFFLGELQSISLVFVNLYKGISYRHIFVRGFPIQRYSD